MAVRLSEKAKYMYTAVGEVGLHPGRVSLPVQYARSFQRTTRNHVATLCHDLNSHVVP
jgi:hypothetical protein